MIRGDREIGLESECISNKVLYHLKPGEVTLFSLDSTDRKDKTHGKLEALENARRIESGPKNTETGNFICARLQGYYKDIRVVPMRDMTTGRRIRGWMLIGISR